MDDPVQLPDIDKELPANLAPPPEADPAAQALDQLLAACLSAEEGLEAEPPVGLFRVDEGI